MTTKLIFYTLFIISVPAFAGKKYQIPTDEITRTDCVASEIQEIDAKAALPFSLDQGTTSTCFAHAAYFLVQYLYNVDQIYHKGIPHPETLSLTDFIAKGCKNTFPTQGGYGKTVLETIKDQFIDVQNHYHIEDVYEFDKIIRSDPVCDVESCCQILYQHFNSNLLPATRDIIRAALLQDKTTAAHSILFKSSAHQSYKKPPPFDTELHFYPDPPLQVNQEMILNRVKTLLQPIPPLNISYPFTLAYCPEENDDGSCDTHETVIAGRRKLCCGNSCTEEWKIINSYGGKEEGWTKASLLSESVIKYGLYLTAIRPCKKTIEDPSPIPLCSSDTLTPFRLHKLAAQGDLAKIQYLFEKEKQKDYLNSPNSAGQYPLSLAVANGKINVVQYLLDQGASIDQKNRTNETPLYIAIKKGHFELVRYLLNHGASPTMSKNGITWRLSPLSSNALLGEIQNYILNYKPAQSTPLTGKRKILEP